MTINNFCKQIVKLPRVTNLKKALYIMYWFLHISSDTKKELTVSDIIKVIQDNRLGNPDPHYLKQELKKSKFTNYKNNKFLLSAKYEHNIEMDIKDIINGVLNEDEYKDVYLNSSVWNINRKYVNKIINQINGSYVCKFYDATAVMIRRLIETLIIECYEELKIESQIKDGNGDYLTLERIINNAIGQHGLNLGRDSKRYLPNIKEKGDLSAHNRRYNATKPDLDKINSEVRQVVEELLHISKII